MPLSPDQQQVLNYIWGDMHIKDGETAEAANVAKRIFSERNDDSSEFSLELAAMAFSLYAVSAKLSKNLTDFVNYASQAAKVATHSFPLATTAEDAIVKGNNWDKVYAGRYAQLELLRNYFNFCLSVQDALPDFHAYVCNLWLTIFTIIEKSILVTSNDTELMLLIEHADYKSAKLAGKNFITQAKNSDTQVDRIITIVSSLLGRAWQEKDFMAVIPNAGLLTGMLVNNLNLSKFILKQIAAKTLLKTSIRQKELRQSWQNMPLDNTQQVAINDVNHLLRLQFVGLGQGRVIAINSIYNESDRQ